MSIDRTERLSKSATATIIGLMASAAATAVAALDPGFMGMIAGFVFIAAAIAFLTWFRLAFVVAQELSPDLFEGVGSVWAVASWFVPLLNVVFPYVIARRIWKAFAQKAGAPPEPPTFFSAWWGCFVLSLITGRLGLPIAVILFIAAGIFGAGAVNATTALIANTPVTVKASSFADDVT